MADAPSGGSWGTFEIILGLVLVIALLSHLSKNNQIPTIAPANTNSSIAAPDTSTARCGLSITTPLSKQKVADSIHLSGSVNGCNWRPSGSVALYAQVINSAGVPLSEFVAVPDTGRDLINTAFDTNITITGNPTPGTGYLILIPATQTEKSITVRIPITFVRN